VVRPCRQREEALGRPELVADGPPPEGGRVGVQGHHRRPLPQSAADAHGGREVRPPDQVRQRASVEAGATTVGGHGGEERAQTLACQGYRQGRGGGTATKPLQGPCTHPATVGGRRPQERVRGADELAAALGRQDEHLPDRVDNKSE